jgi:hypothetical protein
VSQADRERDADFDELEWEPAEGFEKWRISYFLRLLFVLDSLGGHTKAICTNSLILGVALTPRCELTADGQVSMPRARNNSGEMGCKTAIEPSCFEHLEMSPRNVLM